MSTITFNDNTMHIGRAFAILLTLGLSMLSMRTFASDKQWPDPFDVKNENNPYEISTLTCRQYTEMFAAKNPEIIPLVVWTYGLAAGMDEKIVKFSYKEVIGIPLFLLAACKDKDDQTLFNVLIEYHKAHPPKG